MSIEENRNCSCNDNMDINTMNNFNMTSNMNMMSNMNTMPEMNMNTQGRTIDCCEKEEMLQQIRCCDFAINELA